MKKAKWATICALSMGSVMGCGSQPDGEGAEADSEDTGSRAGSVMPEEMNGQRIGRYEVKENALVNKAGIFSMFRRTTDGVTQMMPRISHICVLSELSGNMNSDAAVIHLFPEPSIMPSGLNWALRRGNSREGNMGAICYAHENFRGPRGLQIFWTEDPPWVSISVGWPDCTSRNTGNSWHGDAVTFLNSARGEFDDTGSRAWVNQSPTYQSGRSTFVARTNQCDGYMFASVGTYFVGIPQITAPIFIKSGDVRGFASDAGAEFVVSSNQTVTMARTDSAMCYLTWVGGDFNGNGEKLHIFRQVVNGVERWRLQSTAGGNSSAEGRARCLAFDQTQPAVIPPT
jgi:hypothetical protein